MSESRINHLNLTVPQDLLISLAPMEGVTTAVYRRVFSAHFNGVGRFYTPFLVANQTHHFKQREKKEFTPYRDNLVPQILTASADDFIWAAHTLQDAGYGEVNLNLGCPYPTVFTKGKGSGMLADPERLKRFLEEIFREPDMPRISIKTRIGVKSPTEAGVLTEIFKSFPIAELIVHPRVREEFYEGEIHREVFGTMQEELRIPLAFNGEIRTAEDAAEILSAFPGTRHLMIGRGLIVDPSLARQIRGGEKLKKAELAAFLKDLREAYTEVLYGERDVLFKLKEVWSYLGRNTAGHERDLLDIKKSKNIQEYLEAAGRILEI